MSRAGYPRKLIEPLLLTSGFPESYRIIPVTGEEMVAVFDRSLGKLQILAALDRDSYDI